MASVGPTYGNTIDIEALQGGQVLLPTLASVAPANTTISLKADGTSSLVNVAGLTTLNALGGSLTASNGGTILDTDLTTINNVNLTFDGTGTIATSQWADLDNSNVYVTGGATVALPDLISYSYTASFGTAYLEASGTGSTLSLPGLTSLASVGPTYGNTIDIEALQGGQVLLPTLASVAPANTTISLKADGTSSLVNVAGLTTLNALGGSLTASNGGTILDTDLTTINNVNLTFDGTGTIATSQWADLDNSNVYVTGGATVALPDLISYSYTASFGTAYLEASGTGSTLSLPGLTSLASVGPTYGNTIDIEALQGGQVLLPTLASVAPANTTISLKADGTSSLVNVAGLTTLNALGGSLTASNGGTIQLTSGVIHMTKATATLSNSGTMDVGTLELDSGGTLTGTGTLTGNVVNAGAVNPGGPSGQLTIMGSYTQTAAGTLAFTLSGLQATQYGQLVVNGNAALGGALTASLGNNFVLALGDSFQVMSFTSATGIFTTLTGLQLGANRQLEPTGTATSLSLTAAAAQGPAILSITPSGAVSTAVSAVAITFNELINPTTFTTSQVTLTGPNGPITINFLTGSGDTYQVGFASQLTQGTYTLQVAASVTDLFGNAMGQAFTGTFTISTPDLVAGPISGPAGASFGQTIPISWTVTNSGPGIASTPWTDEIWLSQKTTLDSSATLLLTQSEVAQAPLGSGQSYTVNTNVTLPLTQTAAAGTYYLLLQTNAAGSLAEATASNDIAVSSALALTVPPSPDLVVTDITSPAAALDGAQVVVSWMDVNKGQVTATGPWVDNIYAATDAQGDNPTLLRTFTYPGSLAPGASVQLSKPVNLPTTSGTYWLVVTTNANGAVPEGPGTANNTTVASSSISVTPELLPDLVVETITRPPNGVLGGASVPITFLVTNQGGAPTSQPVWHDQVILSQDPDLLDAYDGTNDTILLNQPVVVAFTNPSYLGPGESYQQAVNVTLPINAEGTWYVYVVPDSSDYAPGSMTEISRTDKLARSDGFNVGLTPPADLTVTSVQAPAEDFSGQPMTMTWTVANNGTGPTSANNWIDAVYMSATPTLSADAQPLATFNHFGSLAAGSSYTDAETVTLPVGVSGPFYFLVKTDLDGIVFENGATGDVGTTTSASIVNLTPPPDLEVASISTVAATALAGHDLAFSYTVTNAGAAATPNYTWQDAFYLSPTPTYDAATAIPLGEATYQGGLDAGASYTNAVTEAIPNVDLEQHPLSGAYYLLVDTDGVALDGQLDPAGVVFELDEANNWLPSASAIQIVSKPADLEVTSAQAVVDGEIGSGVQVSWTVTNRGTGDTVVSSWQDNIYADTGSAPGPNAILLGSFPHNGLLDAGALYAETVTLPADPAVPYASYLAAPYHLFLATNQPLAGASGAPVYEPTPSAPARIAVGQKLANLHVVSVSAVPTAAQTGDSITLAWTVRNNGVGTTNSTYWYDDVWMSTSQTLASGGTDVYLGPVQHANPLAPGQTYTASGTFTLPQTMPEGNYYFIVATDRPVSPANNLYLNPRYQSTAGEGRDLVEESDPDPQAHETATTSTTAVSLGTTPELTVSNVTVPSDATSGQALSVSWRVTNNGSATGNMPITDSVYLSYDQVFDPSINIYVGSVTYRGGVGAGASYTQTAALQLPPGVAGVFYMFVETNSDGNVYERNPVNNAAASPKIQIDLPPLADLVAGTVQVPANALAGLAITITYKVSNNLQSPNPIDGSWYDSLYLSSTPTWNVSDPLLGTVQQTHDLAPGDSYQGTLTAPLPGVTPGPYYVILRTNILNNIPEITLANNLSASLTQTSIDAPELALGASVNIPQVGANQSVYYKVDQVPAGQTMEIKLVSQDPAASNELYVSYQTMPTRSRYDFRYSRPFETDQEITIPTTRAGAYYILVYADNVSKTSEDLTLSAALVPFSVQAVTPGKVGTGPVTLQISGARFTGGTSFQLRMPGGPTLDATRTLLQDSATAFVTFNLAGQRLGNYDIVATQPGNMSTTLPTAVMVVPALPNTVDLNLIVPQVELIGRPGTVTISYANNGNTDLPAPVVFLDAQNAIFQVPGQTTYTGSTLQLYAYNPAGPFGTLPPGFQGSMTLSYEPIEKGIGVASRFNLQTLQDPAEPFDWSAVAAQDVPLDTSPQQWAAMVASAAPVMGSTWGAVTSYIGLDSIQLLADSGPDSNVTTSASLSNFDALLQYVVGVVGAPSPVDPPAPYPVVGSDDQVTIFNAHTNAGGNPIAINGTWPTFLIIADAQGYQDNLGTLAKAIAADTAGGNVNVLLATWLTAPASTPWTAAMQIDTAGQDLGSLLNSLSDIDLSTLTVIGAGFGSYVGSQAAQTTAGFGNEIALNPPSPFAGYLPPDLQQNSQTSTAYETTSLYDTQTSLAGSNQTLATGDVNNPLLQHTYGITWLTQEIEAGQIDLGNVVTLAGLIALPAVNNPLPPSIPDEILLFSAEVDQIAPVDPNNILGPKGVGSNQYVSNTQPLPYEITFTNVPTANAPAQQVTVTQVLDSNLNWQDFRLGEFGFGGMVFDVPANLAFYQTTLDLKSLLGFDVDVTATIDERTGEATWIFTTVDAATGQVPLDPTLGLLPPDNASGSGEGFVTYSIQASQAAPTGAVVNAQATVTFSTQPPLDTPQIFNTIDTGTDLVSTVSALPTKTTADSLSVSWNGQDAVNGSAVHDYNIFVSDNGSSYTPWMMDTNLTTATYAGQPGHTYDFLSVATDNAGNIQPITGLGQASAVIPSTPTSTLPPPTEPTGGPPSNPSVDSGGSGTSTLIAGGGGAAVNPISTTPGLAVIPAFLSIGVVAPGSNGAAESGVTTAIAGSTSAGSGTGTTGRGGVLDGMPASIVDQLMQRLGNRITWVGASVDEVALGAGLLADGIGAAVQSTHNALVPLLKVTGLEPPLSEILQEARRVILDTILQSMKTAGSALRTGTNPLPNATGPVNAPLEPQDESQEEEPLGAFFLNDLPPENGAVPPTLFRDRRGMLGAALLAAGVWTGTRKRPGDDRDEAETNR